jgi:hypothetical protein
MATEQNPFELQPQQQPPPQWGGMPQIVPQGGAAGPEGGSSFQLSPEAMQMMWAPPQQGLMPQPQQIQPPPLPPV